MFCIELNYQTLGLVNEMLYIECGGDYQLPTLKKEITGSLKKNLAFILKCKFFRASLNIQDFKIYCFRI